MEGSETEGVAFDQGAIFAAPTHFVDASLGIAASYGVARVTFGAYKLAIKPDAGLPLLHPVVTIAMPEAALLQFARDVLARAEKLAEEGQ